MEKTLLNISKRGNEIAVKSPFNKDFIKAARALGGRWQAPEWMFDQREAAHVRDACIEHYGTDGLTTDWVTLRVEWKSEASMGLGPISIGGRPVAVALGRRSGAKLEDGIILLQGGFAHGGSVKNWVTEVEAETVVLIRNFPRGKAEKLISEQKNGDDIHFSIEQEQVPCPAIEP